MLFHLYVFLVIMHVITIWAADGHIVTSIIILSHTVVDIQFPPLQICSYRMASLVIYGNALPFTTNSTFLTIVNINICNKKFPNQLYIQRKSHVCYIQSCYIADTCTERVTHFWLSSGRHMHACRAYFKNN